MHSPVTGESASQLPWLLPDAHSLFALTQPLSQASWLTVRRDPAALLLLHGHGSAVADRFASARVDRSRLLDPHILVTTLDWLRRDEGTWIDWRYPSVLPVFETALAVAHHARIIASYTRNCDAEAAWSAGLLAPLGWFAALGVDPHALSDCRQDPLFGLDPLEVQQRLWGMDHWSISRRLARRWQFPDWLRIVVGHLNLPVSAAEQLGADPGLFAVVQLAVSLVEESGSVLGLGEGVDREDTLDHLPLTRDEIAAVRDRFRCVDLGEIFEPEWLDPREHPHLRQLLQQTLDRRRAEAAPFLGPLERDIDRLHRLVVDQRAEEENRLKNAKLSALAEFAAGAGHEINNPLAVISGQSQYLLHGETDERRRTALQSIVRQTQRIHSILLDVMLFARPPKLNLAEVALGELLQSAIDKLAAIAKDAEVELMLNAGDPEIRVGVDERLVVNAVGCLLRNGIEAVSSHKGWVRLSWESIKPGRVDIIVEDNGPGPTTTQREHLFDPFYSGRAAGRGRGMGLSTAWRVAQEHGGDVRYVSLRGGPTRFVLTLPLPIVQSVLSERKTG